MRRLFPIFLGCFLGLNAACNYEYQGSHSPSIEDPPSPQLMLYAEDLTRGWDARLASRSWKTEIDDVRSSGPVHIVAETACPDHYHVVTTGAEFAETYYIGLVMYQRKGKSPWSTGKLPMPYLGFNGCRASVRNEDSDPARIRLVAEQLKGIDISSPVMREFGGRKCREWTRTFSAGKSTFSNRNCYDVNTHELVHSVNGSTSTTYYWNVPVDIKPPI